MNGELFIADRNLVGLLLLLREEERIRSTDLLSINSCYKTALNAANELHQAGLVCKVKAPDHQRKVYWYATERGLEIADRIYILDKEYKGYLRDSKLPIRTELTPYVRKGK